MLRTLQDPSHDEAGLCKARSIEFSPASSVGLSFSAAMLGWAPRSSQRLVTHTVFHALCQVQIDVMPHVALRCAGRRCSRQMCACPDDRCGKL